MKVTKQKVIIEEVKLSKGDVDLLKQIRDICEDHKNCNNCPFVMDDSNKYNPNRYNCPLNCKPSLWGIEKISDKLLEKEDGYDKPQCFGNYDGEELCKSCEFKSECEKETTKLWDIKKPECFGTNYHGSSECDTCSWFLRCGKENYNRINRIKGENKNGKSREASKKS